MTVIAEFKHGREKKLKKPDKDLGHHALKNSFPIHLQK